ncbi:MAG: hypothetical protein JRN44_00785 [Nitrososphaerota archaeon]|jgi:hypothetical protein|nr:hypothetical protein [Nitrososphaerota archaeon]MDG6941786.1 hypothetical protein [Nitrososphaerota archaeon]MDG6947041.1 hypothetical protein [Nitrososphaerota archaeon]MDG6950547.1 hypothetical protein [Nitrososphaerota archaeon]
MNRNLVLIGGVLALIGLFVNVAVDLDNVYDMTTSTLWLLTVIVVFAGAFLGGKKSGSAAPSASGTAGQ